MGRFLVLFQPVEVLDLTPEIRLVVFVLFLLVSLSVRIDEGVGTEDYAIAIFYDSLACDEDVESAIRGVVDAQLMAVELESAVLAMVHKHRRFGDCASNDTSCQVL